MKKLFKVLVLSIATLSMVQLYANTKTAEVDNLINDLNDKLVKIENDSSVSDFQFYSLEKALQVLKEIKKISDKSVAPAAKNPGP